MARVKNAPADHGDLFCQGCGRLGHLCVCEEDGVSERDQHGNVHTERCASTACPCYMDAVALGVNEAGDIAEARSIMQAFLERWHRAHRECEDCWYSCPKSSDYCRDDGDTECDCGKDEADALVAQLKKV